MSGIRIKETNARSGYNKLETNYDEEEIPVI